MRTPIIHRVTREVPWWIFFWQRIRLNGEDIPAQRRDYTWWTELSDENFLISWIYSEDVPKPPSEVTHTQLSFVTSAVPLVRTTLNLIFSFEYILLSLRLCWLAEPSKSPSLLGVDCDGSFGCKSVFRRVRRVVYPLAWSSPRVFCSRCECQCKENLSTLWGGSLVVHAANYTLAPAFLECGMRSEICCSWTIAKHPQILAILAVLQLRRCSTKIPLFCFLASKSTHQTLSLWELRHLKLIECQIVKKDCMVGQSGKFLCGIVCNCGCDAISAGWSVVW